MGNSGGRHRAGRSAKRLPVAGAATIVAAAGAAVLVGMTPTLSMSPQVVNTATVWYLRGTKGVTSNPTDAQYEAFVGRMLDGSGVDSTACATGGTPCKKVDYPASFWPVTGLSDPTFDGSVAKGLTELNGEPIQNGDVIYGYSQGAVVASIYKGQHLGDPSAPDVTYVLVENPNRPNGGILERFNGLYIPILGVSFNGATPNSGPDSPHTVDISRQYDGWSDFPTYPLNLVATANAILGIYYLHGATQTDVTAADLEAAKSSGNSMYYQNDTATNTEYYLIATNELPLLMPFNGIVPEPILQAIDPVLRSIVELGYDRTDYGNPTPAGLWPGLGSSSTANPIQLVSTLATSAGQLAPAPKPSVKSLIKPLDQLGTGLPKLSFELPAIAPATLPNPAVLKLPAIAPDALPNPAPLKVSAVAKNKTSATATQDDTDGLAPKPAHTKVKAPSVSDVTKGLNDVTKGLNKAVSNTVNKAADNSGNKVSGPKHQRPDKSESNGDS